MFVRAASDIPSMASDDVWCCCFLLAKENSQHVCTSPCAPDGAVYTPITFSRVSYVPPDAQREIHCSSSFRQCSAISAAPFRSQTRRKLVRRPQPRAPCSPAKAGACCQMRAACTRWRAGTQQSHPPSFARTALHAQHPPGAPNHQSVADNAPVLRALPAPCLPGQAACNSLCPSTQTLCAPSLARIACEHSNMGAAIRTHHGG